MPPKKNSPTLAAKAFKKVKQQSISTLKKHADKLTSLNIRRKHANPEGIVACFTCGKKMDWKQSQCGHFVSRNHSATRYSENNLRPQCVGCNVFGRGQLHIFAQKLLRELGTEGFNQLLSLGKSTHQFTTKELEEIIENTKVELKKYL